MYKVEERDLVKDIQGFPIEVVQKMLEYQVSQGNKEDISIFQSFAAKDSHYGGFSWTKTCEGIKFWNDVIRKKRFDIFFDKYPKQPTEQTNFKYLYIKCTSKDAKDIIKTLQKYGGRNTTDLQGRVTKPYQSLYCIDRYQNIRFVMNDWNPNLYELILKEGKELKLFPDKEIYFRGDANRGSEIIKALEKLGGQNHLLEGCNPNNIYVIDFDNNIKSYNSEHFISQLIIKYWKEEFLPEELIEIEGKKYKKEDVLDKLKDLKTY